MTPPAKRGTGSYQGKGPGWSFPALSSSLLSHCQLPQVKVFSWIPTKQTYPFSPVLWPELDDQAISDALCMKIGVTFKEKNPLPLKNRVLFMRAAPFFRDSWSLLSLQHGIKKWSCCLWGENSAFSDHLQIKVIVVQVLSCKSKGVLTATWRWGSQIGV